MSIVVCYEMSIAVRATAPRLAAVKEDPCLQNFVCAQHHCLDCTGEGIPRPHIAFNSLLVQGHPISNVKIPRGWSSWRDRVFLYLIPTVSFNLGG